MKTKLPNHNCFWYFILIVLCYGQISIAQNDTPNSSTTNMQGFTLEYINLDGLNVVRELQLSFDEVTSDGFDDGYDIKNLDINWY